MSHKKKKKEKYKKFERKSLRKKFNNQEATAEVTSA